VALLRRSLNNASIVAHTAGWDTLCQDAPMNERPVLVAPDSFKGTFRAAEVAGAIGRGLERAGLMPPDLCPVADGGEGTMEALLLALGGEVAGVEVQDPLGRPVQAQLALVEEGGTAVLEMAWASGLGLVAEGDRDAWAATTYGTGELIAAAVDAGAQVVVVGVGGSATTDGGAGAIEAIDDHGGLRGTRIVVLCDVRTPFERAPAVFAPQKGADPAMVGRLEERLDALARRLPRDPRGVPMTGAAGGLSGGLWAAYGAALEPGAQFVLDALDFDGRMRAARAVVTGEGKLDEQTLEGKLVGEIGTRTRQAGVPLHAIVGTDRLDPFGKRIIDLQLVQEATDLAEIEAAGETLGRALATGAA
jgi:glycerate kinase